MTITTQDQQARLRWACRRGMLELDLLLNPFLEKVYPQLSTEEQQLFVELLSSTDQELYTWLLGKEEPEDKRFLPIIDRMRHGS